MGGNQSRNVNFDTQLLAKLAQADWRSKLTHTEKQSLCRLARNDCADCPLNTTHAKLNSFIQERIAQKCQQCSRVSFRRLREKNSQSNSILIEVFDRELNQSYFVKLFYRSIDLKGLPFEGAIDFWGNHNMENECDLYVYISDKFSRQDNPVMKKFFLNLVQVCQFNGVGDLESKLLKEQNVVNLDLGEQLMGSLEFEQQNFQMTDEYEKKLRMCKITAITTNLQHNVVSLHAFVRGRYPFRTKSTVFGYLVEALNYMHNELGILHNDLHFGNILVAPWHNPDTTRFGIDEKKAFRPLLFDWDRSVSLDTSKVKLRHNTENVPLCASRDILTTYNSYIMEKVNNSIAKLTLPGAGQANITKADIEGKLAPGSFVDIFMLYICISDIFPVHTRGNYEKRGAIWTSIFNDTFFYTLAHQLIGGLEQKGRQNNDNQVYIQSIAYLMTAIFECLHEKVIAPYIRNTTWNSNSYQYEPKERKQIFDRGTPDPRALYETMLATLGPVNNLRTGTRQRIRSKKKDEPRSKSPQKNEPGSQYLKIRTKPKTQSRENAPGVMSPIIPEDRDADKLADIDELWTQ